MTNTKLQRKLQNFEKKKEIYYLSGEVMATEYVSFFHSFNYF